MPRFCTKCGNALREKDRFCRKCGAQVRAISPEPSAFGAAPSYNADGNAGPSGSILPGGTGMADPEDTSVRKATIVLTLSEMLEGCSKVVDFGTGKKYELTIPAGLAPDDVVTVEDQSLVDGDTGKPCRIELSLKLG